MTAARRVTRWLSIDWRLTLGAIVVAAAVIRGVFFVGFGLVDDACYLYCVDHILDGGYPPLAPLNPYPYRPLLLYLLAAGVALLGYTDLGVVAPMFVASLVTTALIFVFVRKLIDRSAAWWCALLFAFEPFNVVNSTTMNNDVILACLVFAGLGLFMIGDSEPAQVRGRRFFVGAAAVMLAAFLVKVAVFAAIAALALYSLVSLYRRPAVVLRGHTAFHGAFLVGLAGVCVVYFVATGDWFWQFRSEAAVYDRWKPEPGLPRSPFNYTRLMSEYPQSLFGLSGVDSFTYFEHGMLFWLLIPAAVWVLLRLRHRALTFFVAAIVVIFAFFQFYPQFFVPYYMPLFRQSRYLEMLIPPTVVVVGTAFYHWSRHRPILARVLFGVMLADFTYEAARRSLQYNDSLQDMRALARYVASDIVPTGLPLAVDPPGKRALLFYLHEQSPVLEVIAPDQLNQLRNSYVAVGGSRATWWPPEQVTDVATDRVPQHWTLTHEVIGGRRPWRRTNLRVYLVPGPAEEAGARSRPGTEWIREMGTCQQELIATGPAEGKR